MKTFTRKSISPMFYFYDNKAPKVKSGFRRTIETRPTTGADTGGDQGGRGGGGGRAAAPRGGGGGGGGERRGRSGRVRDA